MKNSLYFAPKEIWEAQKDLPKTPEKAIRFLHHPKSKKGAKEAGELTQDDHLR